MSETEFHPEKDRKPGRIDPAERKVVSSEQLMAGAREIAIRHEGQEYRLQVTRNGKLILTK
jgi:hemin uptake protein HemP